MDRREPPVRLGQRVWRVGAHLLAVFPVRGREAGLLFGMGVGATAPSALDQLRRLGVLREEVRCLALSHAHSDHAASHAAGKGEETLARELFDRYYQHELRLYAPDTILNGCRVLARRSLERE